MNIKENIMSLFKSGDGQQSMMRVMCIAALINAIAMGWYVLMTGKQDEWLVITFLGVAFTGKVAQKVFENKPCNGETKVNGVVKTPVVDNK